MLNKYFDSIVMLTSSDWRKEMRSNRYHYATRFAKHLPVYFIQADLFYEGLEFEWTEIENITIIHVLARYIPKQTLLLNKALSEAGAMKPLLWIYNPLFAEFAIHRYSPLKIHHATEDYFEDRFVIGDDDAKYKDILRFLLRHIDLLVGISSGILESYQKNGKYNRKHIFLSNGCDYSFYARELELPENAQTTVFFQGNINDRLDFSLIKKVVKALPDFEFMFCGRLLSENSLWNDLTILPNFKFLGSVSPEKLRDLAYQTDVGIIPFVNEKRVTEVYVPLKAFEYAACGLPVVSIPFKDLLQYHDVFHFAETSEGFIEQIKLAAASRHNLQRRKLIQNTAKTFDYDNNFKKLLSTIDCLMEERRVRETA